MLYNSRDSCDFCALIQFFSHGVLEINAKRCLAVDNQIRTAIFRRQLDVHIHACFLEVAFFLSHIKAGMVGVR